MYYYSQYKKKQTEAKQLTSEVNKLEVATCKLEQVLEQHCNLQACTQQAVECSDKVADVWNSMEHGLTALVDHLENAASTDADICIIMAELNIANKSWREVL